MTSLRLVDTDTGEVVDLLTAEEARDLTDDIADDLETAWVKVVKAYERQAWRALGYDSWDAYTTAEFGAARLRLPREERQDVVQSLTEAGLSTRAIAAATGTSHTQVQRDRRAGGTNVPPAPRDRGEVEPRFGNKVKGLDGKTYKRPEPKPAAPVRLRSDEEQAAYEAEQEHRQHVRILTSALEQLVNGWIYLPNLPANPLRDEALEALNESDRAVVIEVEALYQAATR